jgi:hypothetical protein
MQGRSNGLHSCTNAKAHAPRSAGAGDGRGVGVMAWGGHEKWAADRGCHAATCSWKEIPRKHGCIHARSSPNPAPAQVTKPAPRSIGGTQANKLLLLGFGAHHQKSCHLHRRLISTRHHVIIAGPVMYPPETQQARTAPTSHQICHRSSIPHERLAHPRRGGKLEFKQERYPPLDGASCSPLENWEVSIKNLHELFLGHMLMPSLWIDDPRDDPIHIVRMKLPEKLTRRISQFLKVL